jgi:two-component system, NtrC family, sensor kinase
VNRVGGYSDEVMIVDDDPESLRVVEELLKRANYRVRSVLGGQYAMEAIQENPPALLLLELEMIGVAGLELCCSMKRDKSLAQIPVVFLSGSAAMTDKVAAFHSGAVDFIAKPFEEEELVLRIELHLRLRLQQRSLEEKLAKIEARGEEQSRKTTAELLKLFTALEQSPVSVLIMDAKGNIDYVNRKFTEVTGYSFDEVKGLHASDLRTDASLCETFKELLNTVGSGKGWNGELRNNRKDGSFFWERVSIAPVFAIDESTTTHIVSFNEDITAQREIESQLHQAQKMEAIGQLAAGIAHEINTPTQFVSDSIFFLRDAFTSMLEVLAVQRHALSVALNTPSSQSLLAEVQAAEEKADVDYVTTNAPQAFESSLDGLKRIGSIVRAMKEFSHPDNNEMALADLNAAIANTLTIARNEYKYVADVETDFAELPPIRCHIGALNQVFLNLLVNAAHAIGDATEKRGKRGIIRVRTRLEPEHVRIEIEDTGSGIPEAVRSRIFEPFFTTKEVGKGTGQGLTLAHGIVVKRHKGTLTFESEEGKGTTFFVRLPLRDTPSGDLAMLEAKR